MALTQTVDSPTTNYCTMFHSRENVASMVAGNTKVTTDSNDGDQPFGMMSFDSEDADGYYFIMRPTATSSSIGAFAFGVASVAHVAEHPRNDANDANSWFFAGNGGITNTSYIANGTWDAQGNGTGSINDYYQIAVKAGKIYFGINNTWYDSSDGTFANAGHAFDNLTGRVIPMFQHAHASAGTVEVEFGATGYTHAKPTGFKDITAVNTALATQAITDGSSFFQASTYTGNTSSNTVTQAGMVGSPPVPTTAKVNGAISSSRLLTVDTVVGTISQGMTVTGTGISGTVTLSRVNSQTSVELSSEQTISDNVDLTFALTNATYTNSSFAPGIVWIKARGTGSHPATFDVTRGGNKGIRSSLNFVEYTESNLSFESNGFSMTGTGSAATINDSQTYVGWQWAAGGTPTADNSAGAGNTPTSGSVKIDGSNLGSALAGTMPATRLSANTTSGFSVVLYESKGSGDASAGTLATGLTSTPQMIMVKNLDTTDNWAVYHSSVASDPATDYLVLNEDHTPADNNTWWNDTAPSADGTVFTVGTAGSTNDTGGATTTHIAYCFAEIPGYSKFGKIISGGDTASPHGFVECGFTPSLVFIKRISGADSWYVYDRRRALAASNSAGNPNAYFLKWDDNAAEATTNQDDIDFLSNGFQYICNQAITTSDTLIYGAWAEHPFAVTSGANTTPACAI